MHGFARSRTVWAKPFSDVSFQTGNLILYTAGLGLHFAFNLDKFIEDSFLVFARDADAGVFEAEDNGAATVGLSAQSNMSPAGKLQSI